MNLLVAIDGSDAALRALEHLLARGAPGPEDVLHLVNVQPPLSADVARFIDRAQRDDYHREQGRRALAAAEERLRARGVAHRSHLLIGDPAEALAAFCREHACAEIHLGRRGHGPLGSLLGSVSRRLLELTEVPVTLVR